MNPQAPSPSRSLKLLSLLSRLVLGVVVVLWIIVAVAGALLHFWIVPRIGDYREAIETQATTLLGSEVTLGEVRAYSSGLLPSFELSNLVVHDAQNRPALTLGKVRATLSPRSLLSLNFEHLLIEKPILDIRRDKQGGLWVAGLSLSSPAKQSSSALDWFFSQNHFEIAQGEVQWLDERLLTHGQTPQPLVLSNVNFSSRNPLHRHLLSLTATPPPGWGDQITFNGDFTQSLINRHRGQFDQWSGELFAQFSHLDVAQLRRYVLLDAQIREGNGAARAWLDIQKGQVQSGQLDLALNRVDVRLAHSVGPLALDRLNGRLTVQRVGEGYELSTQGLQFKTRSGLNWPGGNFNLSYQPPQGDRLAQHQFRGQSIDLAVLRQLVESLPMDPQLQSTLQSLAPQGQVSQMDVRWQGSDEHISLLQASGRIEGLTLAAEPSGTPTQTGRPGFSNANLSFDFGPTHGKATLGIENGALHFPGVWDDPLIPVSQLSAQVNWQVRPDPLGDRIQLEVSKGVVKNADAEGQFTATWETADPAKSATKSRFPGILNLQGKLSRADGARVWRYLPSLIPVSARDYVQQAVREGSASDVRFAIHGNLNDMPFAKPGTGQFLIESKVDQAVLAYVPPSLQSAGEAPWPAFSQLSGDLIFNGASMEVRNARAAIAGLPGLKISKANVKIADLENPVVKVQAQASGALDDMLKFVNQSPLKSMTSGALLQAKASGSSDYTLGMTLPVDDFNKTQVEGSVKLASNDIQLSPDTPPLRRSTGVVNFNESGFQIKGGKASLLGGEVEFEGGSTTLNALGKLRVGTEAPKVGEPDISIKGHGVASAQGLQQAQELGFVPRFAKVISGTAPYNAHLTIRNERPELVITSSLQGMALHLPTPFTKAADVVMPFVYENLLVPGSAKNGGLQDTLRISLGNKLQVNYLRSLAGPEPRVLRGDIGVGLASGETPPQPSTGVGANILVSSLDIDTWSRLFEAVSPPSGTTSAASTTSASDYLPRILALRSNEILWNGRSFQNVVAGISREGNVWRANVDAKQLAGYIEYKPSATDPRLYARLSRAQLGAAQQVEVEQVLDNTKGVVPALDMEIDNFELAGRSLGRVQVQAHNRTNLGGRGEWRLTKLQITKDFAQLTATGTWSDSVSVPLTAQVVRMPTRRMLLNFKLDVSDAGELLDWVGKEKTVRNGKGKLEGTVAWQGSPFSVHYPSLSGQMSMNLQNGQFLKVDPGAAKLLSVLSLQSLPRRLTLDFRDVFSEGFSFDTLKGDISLDKGVATSQNLRMSGLNALVLMEGTADIIKETQNLRVVVVPEISATGVSLAYAAINPAVGIGSLIAQWLLSGPLAEAATREYLIEGSWAEPSIKEVKHKPAEKTPEKSRDKAPDSLTAPKL
jgi:uncharacterized protein (TIGR02099 family)